MAEEEKQGEGQEGQDRAEGEKASPKIAPANQLGNLVSTAVSVGQQKWVVVLLAFASLVLFLLIIVFGGVWAAAIKGYFGEKLTDPTAIDDPTRTALVKTMENSPVKLGPDGPPRSAPCHLVIPDSKDREFMKKGYTAGKGVIGVPEGTVIHPDKAMLLSMDYLCKKHNRLAISHFISVYINMRLDPEQQTSRDPQIIANISAHTKGQAYDLVEVDFVYKVFRPGVCTKPPAFIMDVYYYNDRSQLLLFLPCKEKTTNVNTLFLGFPAQAIPIRAIWQDQPNSFALGGLPLNINTALRTLASYLGLPPDALRFAGGSLDQMLSQIGRSYLEQLLKLPPGSLSGNDLATMVKSAFDIKLAELIKGLPRPDWGTTIKDWVFSSGAGWWEQALGLFPGSFQGWNNPTELFRSVGLETAANILRIPSEVLKDPAKAAEFLKSLAPEDLDALAQDQLGQKIIPIIEALKNGDTEALDGALQAYGAQILELTFRAPPGSFGPCELDEIPRRCPNPYTGLPQVAERTGIDVGTLTNFVKTLLEDGSFTGLFEEKGVPILEGALRLPAGSISKILSGEKITFDAATIQNVASRFGVDTTVAQQLLSAIGQGQQLLASMQQIGSTIVSQAFQLSDPLALFKVVTGVAPEQLKMQIEQELKNLMEKLNLPPELVQLQKLLSGNLADIVSVLKSLGGIQLGDVFGLPLGDIQKLIGGDVSVLLNLPAFQDLIKSVFDALGLDINKIADFLKGSSLLSRLATIGNQLNGLLSLLGIDQWLVMERVYRPEARYKVHLVIKELLDMPFELDDIDLRVTQLITGSYPRDVQPFELDGTLDKVYGKGRSKNFGLFSMKEARDHLHVGY